MVPPAHIMHNLEREKLPVGAWLAAVSAADAPVLFLRLPAIKGINAHFNILCHYFVFHSSHPTTLLLILHAVALIHIFAH
jgi:hypothetical protein